MIFVCVRHAIGYFSVENPPQRAVPNAQLCVKQTVPIRRVEIMRIISGIARGANLKAGKGRAFRPTLDRVRESIFSSLGDIEGETVIDLFAGSGALGLEAVSRGAGKAIFVENQRHALQVIQRNIKEIKRFFPTQSVASSEQKIEVIAGNAGRIWQRLPELKNRIDIIFADPPYHEYSDNPENPYNIFFKPEFTAWAGKALLVLEHDRKTFLPWYPASEWRLIKTREFSSNAVSYARLPDAAISEE